MYARAIVCQLLGEDNEVTFSSRGNTKTGPMPTTMSAPGTCPPSCPLKDWGCYAKQHWTGKSWAKVPEKGMDWDEFCSLIKSLPPGQFWRHNVAGDLPGKGERIDPKLLGKLVQANRGKKGFTYSHKRPGVGRNAELIKRANDQGFTVNLSANNLAQADEYKALGIAPVVTVMPMIKAGDERKIIRTPAGNRVVICPASLHKGVTCAACTACANPKRGPIVGFPAHGWGRLGVDRVARGLPAKAEESLACQLIGRLIPEAGESVLLPGGPKAVEAQAGEYQVGDQVEVVDGGKTFQGKVKAKRPDGSYDASFEGHAPAKTQFKPTEMRKVAPRAPGAPEPSTSRYTRY